MAALSLHDEQGLPSDTMQVIVWSSALTLDPLQRQHNTAIFEVPLEENHASC